MNIQLAQEVTRRILSETLLLQNLCTASDEGDKHRERAKVERVHALLCVHTHTPCVHQMQVIDGIAI